MSTTIPAVAPAVLEARRKVAEAADYVRSKTTLQPKVAIIVGTGLSGLAKAVESPTVLPYGQIPNFPVSTAPGHEGNLLLGTLEGQNVVLMQGRFHTYEGYTPQDVAMPIRLFKALGVETLIVTCATGGLNFRYNVGDLMVIVDHLNLTGNNPLIGPNDPELGDRFPVMFDCYRPELRELAHASALKAGIRLQEGVYAGVTGPAYFTKAELRYLIRIGADAIGMSTVGEVIAATHAGLKVLGLGAVSDLAIPDAGSHHATTEEVLAGAARAAERLEAVVRGVLAEL